MSKNVDGSFHVKQRCKNGDKNKCKSQENIALRSACAGGVGDFVWGARYGWLL